MSSKDVSLGIAQHLAIMKHQHGVQVYAKSELGRAIELGHSRALTYSQLNYVVRASSNIAQAVREKAVETLATALRVDHPHIHKLGLAELQLSHLAVLKNAWKAMEAQLETYLRSGTFALAADKNSAFKMDTAERTDMQKALWLILLNLKMRLDAASRAPYGEAFRNGKEVGVEALEKAGAVIDSKGSATTFTASDALKLNTWLAFHDTATSGLIEDIKGRIEAVFSELNAGGITSEEAFVSEVLSAAGVEGYRLPMYSWMSFSIAEDAQKSVFAAFNEERRLAKKAEWKYKWVTAGDSNVCPVCEAYGEIPPRYLNEWEDEPGNVHVFCRCDWLPIPPEE